jgi:hypothetical protein
MQGNPSLFVWFYLDLLGWNYRMSCLPAWRLRAMVSLDPDRAAD